MLQTTKKSQEQPCDTQQKQRNRNAVSIKGHSKGFLAKFTLLEGRALLNYLQEMLFIDYLPFFTNGIISVEVLSIPNLSIERFVCLFVVTFAKRPLICNKDFNVCKKILRGFEKNVSNSVFSKKTTGNFQFNSGNCRETQHIFAVNHLDTLQFWAIGSWSAVCLCWGKVLKHGKHALPYN